LNLYGCELEERTSTGGLSSVEGIGNHKKMLDLVQVVIGRGELADNLDLRIRLSWPDREFSVELIVPQSPAPLHEWRVAFSNKLRLKQLK